MSGLHSRIWLRREGRTVELVELARPLVPINRTELFLEQIEGGGGGRGGLQVRRYFVDPLLAHIFSLYSHLLTSLLVERLLIVYCTCLI